MSDVAAPVLPLRVEAKINRDGPAHALGPCWDWTAGTTGVGYGATRLPGVPGVHLAHRVVYEILVGPVPSGHELDHLCERTVCVNPAHLEPVTHQENVDRYYRGRKACRNGHPVEPDRPRNARGRRDCDACVRGQQERRRQRLTA